MTSHDILSASGAQLRIRIAKVARHVRHPIDSEQFFADIKDMSVDMLAEAPEPRPELRYAVMGDRGGALDVPILTENDGEENVELLLLQVAYRRKLHGRISGGDATALDLVANTFCVLAVKARRRVSL